MSADSLQRYTVTAQPAGSQACDGCFDCEISADPTAYGQYMLATPVLAYIAGINEDLERARRELAAANARLAKVDEIAPKIEANLAELVDRIERLEGRTAPHCDPGRPAGWDES